MRVSLPDRPGSLGAVATALGSAQADITAVEIVERRRDRAIDDFILDIPPGTMPDALISACTAVPGVEVLWLSPSHVQWSLQGDVDVLHDMIENPSHAKQILTEQAPAVFRVAWAAHIDPVTKVVLHATALAPDMDAPAIAQLGSTSEARATEVPDTWLSGWSGTVVAIAPFKDGQAIVVGRHGGPGFLASEIARLSLLAALAP